MSHRPSSIYSSIGNTSTLNAPQQSALQSRINAKKQELENLKQLRDLSATLAEQMTSLEQKLSTLRDGTEAVSHVLQNWDGVLGVIGMAGAKVQKLADDSAKSEEAQSQTDQQLPVTLVRIPVQDVKKGEEG